MDLNSLIACSPTLRRTTRARTTGQSVVEFALVGPILLLLVIAIADFGRIYASAVVIEASAREAADYGSFHARYWEVDPVAVPPIDNRSVIEAAMEKRACTAAAGSHLEGYQEPSGTVNHSTCTNPTFLVALEPDNDSCWESSTDPPCVVHVTMQYTFDLLLHFPALPSTVQITRESRFWMQDLTPP